MSHLALYLLGPPRIELDGQPIHIGRRKAVALLAYLAVERGSRSADASAPVHSRDALATLLWPDHDQRGARGRLRRTLSTLNRTIGAEWLTVDRETVGLNPGADPSTGFAQHPERSTRADLAFWLDVDQFRQRLAACEAHAHPLKEPCPDCLARLTEATELYRDDFMSGFTLPDSLAFDEWQRYQAERLRDELASVLERLVACHSSQAEYESAIAHVRRWLELDPLRERAHRQLMELYAEAGRRTLALRQYRACVRVLEEGLGVTPSAETTQLYERICAGVVGPWSAQVPRTCVSETLPSATSMVPHNLPSQSTSFIGREQELAELSTLIASPDKRLVSILGPGGIGKTRLALSLAERYLGAAAERDTVLPNDRAAPAFPDGVFFVPLAGLSAPDQIVPSIADAFGFRLGADEGESGTSEQLVLDYLREKRLLLILDNLEHLMEGVDLVAEILNTAPDVQVMTTSRERLHLHGEHACTIEGLDYPDSAQPTDWADYGAVQLFLHTAYRVQTGFELAHDDVASLTQICRSLEGMPLGIELAAGWVDVLSLADIAAEIQHSLGFLKTEWRDIPARHRSMRAVFDTTWRCLSEVEQDIFAQLSVFRGGFTRSAARDVAGADFSALARLVGKSLLQFNRTGERYEIHELLRQYGTEKLASQPAPEAAARERHSTFFCNALGRLGDEWDRGRHLAATFDIEADWANVRTAWERAAHQGYVARLDRALDGLYQYALAYHLNKDWDAIFQLAINGLTERSKPLGADGHRVLAKALLCRSAVKTNFYFWEITPRPEIQQSKALLKHPALADCDTRSERALLHVMMGWEAHPDWSEAKRHFEQALALQLELGSEGQVAYSFRNIADACRGLGEYDEAKEHFEKSIARFLALGNVMGAIKALLCHGELGRYVGDYEAAQRRYEKALLLARDQGDRSGVALALTNMGGLAGFLGDFQAEVGYLRESAALWRAVGNREDRSRALAGLSMAHWFCGEFDHAYAQIEESLAIAEETGPSAPLLDATANRAWLDAAAGRYDTARAYAQKTITLYEYCGITFLVWRGIAQGVLGWVALTEREYKEAGQTLQESITTFQELDIPYLTQEFTAWSLAALGRAELGLGNGVDAHQHLCEALAMAVEIRAFIPLLHLMPIIPVALAEEEEPSLKERAVELYALAESHPFVAKAQLFEDIAGKYIAAATETLPPYVIAGAQKRGRALDWWETAEMLLNELEW